MNRLIRVGYGPDDSRRDVAPGDLVDYETYGGAERAGVLVTGLDTENGQPVFDGISAQGMPVWGYLSQVKTVYTSRGLGGF